MPRPLSPFARLTEVLKDSPAGRPPINLTVGEPGHGVPSFVGPVLAAATADFGRYPPITGTPAFRAAAAAWCERRFALPPSAIDRDNGVLPLNGSRDGLFSAAIEAVRRRGDLGKPAILMPNPFYQVYAAGAEVAGAEVVMLQAGSKEGFLPDLASVSPDILARTVAIYYASPANPQGAVATAHQWAEVIGLARRHDFMVFADECYSEIYRRTPPAGALRAAIDHNGDLDHVIGFNSLSKRSNLPGLRCGFAAGDPAFLAGWAASRNVYGPQVPLPALTVAVAAYADEAHVEENRALYNAKFAAAEAELGDIFGPVSPEGGFFLWLDVAPFGGGLKVAGDLWRQEGVRTVPGGFLAKGPADDNPGSRFIRVAMVADFATTLEALQRMRRYFTAGG